uniref:Uncharacterized protein n=1 Tax=Rhizophora mucronata TaxID=61149 RepID=A0A2P2IYW4_RHIMU
MCNKGKIKGRKYMMLKTDSKNICNISHQTQKKKGTCIRCHIPMRFQAQPKKLKCRTFTKI